MEKNITKVKRSIAAVVLIFTATLVWPEIKDLCIPMGELSAQIEKAMSKDPGNPSFPSKQELIDSGIFTEEALRKFTQKTLRHSIKAFRAVFLAYNQYKTIYTSEYYFIMAKWVDFQSIITTKTMDWQWLLGSDVSNTLGNTVYAAMLLFTTIENAESTDRREIAESTLEAMQTHWKILPDEMKMEITAVLTNHLKIEPSEEIITMVETFLSETETP